MHSLPEGQAGPDGAPNTDSTLDYPLQRLPAEKDGCQSPPQELGRLPVVEPVKQPCSKLLQSVSRGSNKAHLAIQQHLLSTLGACPSSTILLWS